MKITGVIENSDKWQPAVHHPSVDVEDGHLVPVDRPCYVVPGGGFVVGQKLAGVPVPVQTGGFPTYLRITICL